MFITFVWVSEVFKLPDLDFMGTTHQLYIKYLPYFAIYSKIDLDTYIRLTRFYAQKAERHHHGMVILAFKTIFY